MLRSFGRCWVAFCWTLCLATAWLPHPVVLMGGASRRWKAPAHHPCPKRRGASWPAGPRWPRCCRWARWPLPELACWAAAKLHPALGLALQMLWCGQALATPRFFGERCVQGTGKGDPARGPWAVARIVVTQNPDRRGRDQSRRGDRGRERQRRRHCAAFVYASWRGTAGADPTRPSTRWTACSATKTKSIFISGAVPPNWTMRQLAARKPPGRAALGGCGGADGQQRPRGVAHLAARPPPPRQPQQRPDRERLRRGHWACSWQARPITLANITI